MSGNNQKSALLNSCIVIIITGTLLILCAILGLKSFSWFASVKSVSASGMSVSTAEIPRLFIRKVTGGADIGDYTVNDIPDNRLNVEYDLPGITKISPGITGSFKIYLVYEGSGSITIYPEVILKTDRELTGTESEIAAERAERYASNHIVFSFDAKNTVATVDESITLLPNTEVECEVSWEWVAEYDDLRISGSVTSENYSDYLYGINNDEEYNAASLTDKKDAYNNADMFIATYMNPLFWHIGFSTENT